MLGLCLGGTYVIVMTVGLACLLVLNRIYLAVPTVFEDILHHESKLFKQIMYLFHYVLNGNMIAPGAGDHHPFEGQMVCHGGPQQFALFHPEQWTPQDYGSSVPILHPDMLKKVSMKP